MLGVGLRALSSFCCGSIKNEEDEDSLELIETSKNKSLISKKEIAITLSVIVGVMALIAVGAILMKLGFFDKVFNYIQQFNKESIIVTSVCAGIFEVGAIALAILAGYGLAHRGDKSHTEGAQIEAAPAPKQTSQDIEED